MMRSGMGRQIGTPGMGRPNMGRPGGPIATTDMGMGNQATPVQMRPGGSTGMGRPDGSAPMITGPIGSVQGPSQTLAQIGGSQQPGMSAQVIPRAFKKGGLVSKGKHSSVTPKSGKAGSRTKPCKIY